MDTCDFIFYTPTPLGWVDSTSSCTDCTSLPGHSTVGQLFSLESAAGLSVDSNASVGRASTDGGPAIMGDAMHASNNSCAPTLPLASAAGCSEDARDCDPGDVRGDMGGNSSTGCQGEHGLCRKPTMYRLNPIAVLQPPEGLSLPRGLPSASMGSDHVCIVADFRLSKV